MRWVGEIDFLLLNVHRSFSYFISFHYITFDLIWFHIIFILFRIVFILFYIVSFHFISFSPNFFDNNINIAIFPNLFPCQINKNWITSLCNTYWNRLKDTYPSKIKKHNWVYTSFPLYLSLFPFPLPKLTSFIQIQARFQKTVLDP